MSCSLFSGGLPDCYLPSPAMWGVWIDGDQHAPLRQAGLELAYYHCMTCRNRLVPALYVGDADECMRIARQIEDITRRIATIYSNILDARRQEADNSGGGLPTQ